MKVMNQNHPKWGEFLKRLEGPEGCDFHEKEPGNPESITWKCKGDSNKDFATKILKDMPDVDCEASLEFFDENGGFCDCEIMFNIATKALD